MASFRLATPSHAQAVKPAPPIPIGVKKVELGRTPWNPQWDQIIEKALPPEMYPSMIQVAAGMLTAAQTNPLPLAE
jgi:hypothetical protein